MTTNIASTSTAIQYHKSTAMLKVPDGMLSALSSQQPSQTRRAASATSAQQQQHLPRLKFEDFMPSAESEQTKRADTFQELVDRANEWLSTNRAVISTGLQVKTCETVTWMSADNQVTVDSSAPKTRLAPNYGDVTLLSKSVLDRSKTYYTRGLRLWLVGAQQTAASATQSGARRIFQKLRYFDIVPSDMNDTIADLANRANSTIERRHITGRVLTVETVSVPILSLSNGCSLSKLTRWTEDTSVDTPYVFILRVFYNSKDTQHSLNGAWSSGTPRHKRLAIGIKDMLPSIDSGGNYEGFDSLVAKTNSWLKEQRESTIINLQSVMIYRAIGKAGQANSPGNGGVSCHFVTPGVNNTDPIELLRILRIAVLRPQNASGAPGPINREVDGTTPLTRPIVVSFRSVVPEVSRSSETQSGRQMTTRWQTETMKQTFAKASAILQHNSDCELISAETVVNPLQIYVHDDIGDMDIDDRMYFVFTIRLFLATGLLSSDPNYASTKRMSAMPPFDGSTRNRSSSLGGGGTTTATSGGGREPLFLSHVVTGRFQYRWLVMAVSAFTCMTIIVILSVVYSNS